MASHTDVDSGQDVKTPECRVCLVTLTGRIESDIRDLLLCAATCCCCCCTALQRHVAHRRGVAENTAGCVCGADDGTRLGDGGAEDGSGRCHGQAPLPGYVCHAGA